jgi:CBS domain-containing protein
MFTGEYCNREIVVCNESDSLRSAVELMRKHHVGDIIVVRSSGGVNTPVGILTDRDIVIEVLAQNVAIDSLNVGDVMSDQLVSVTEDTGLAETLDVMRAHGIRRMPVIDRNGTLQGIISIDDFLELLAEQVQKLAILIKTEQQHERHLRS